MNTHTQIRYLHLLIVMVMLTALSPRDLAQAQRGDSDEASVAVKTLEEAVKSRRIKQESVEAAAKVGGAAVIVKVRLPRPFRPVGNLASGELDRQGADIRIAQDAVLKAIAGTKFSEVKRFRFIPWMALTGETATLRALVASKDVLRVRADELLKPALATSVPLIGGDRVRAAAGSAGAGQTVAILDTGVDQTHPFLAGRIVSQACFSTSNPFISTSNVCPSGNDSTRSGSGVPCRMSVFGCFHGTAVAGIAAGRANPAAGIAFSGVAPDASIIAIQVASAQSSSSGLNPCDPDPQPCATFLVSDVIEGLEHVLTLRNTFRIAAVNLSLGSGWYTSQDDCDDDNDDYKDAIDNLRSVKIATVAGSGNDANASGSFRPGIARPACLSSAISVGWAIPPLSVGLPERVSEQSRAATFLNFLAPGGGITSSAPPSSHPSGFGIFNGTSIAAPHLTGSIAVLQSLQPGQSVDDIINTLTRTGNWITDTRINTARPRVRLDAAVEAQSGAPLRPSNLRVTAATGRSITVSWNDNSRSERRFEVTANDVTNRRLVPIPINPAPRANRTMGTIAGLIPNTQYELLIRACNAAGRCSANTDPVFHRTLDTVPRPPVALRIQSVSDGGFTIAWNIDVTNPVTSVRLRRSLTGLVCSGSGAMRTCAASDSVWTSEPNIGSSSPQIFTKSDLAGNWSFQWRLQACHAGVCSTDAIGPTVRSPTPAPGSPPAAPTNLRICQSSIEERRICGPGLLLEWWDNSDDEDRFEFEWAQAGARITNWNTVLPPLAANSRSHLMSELTRGGLYFFRVRACRLNLCSTYSNRVSFTAP